MEPESAPPGSQPNRRQKLTALAAGLIGLGAPVAWGAFMIIGPGKRGGPLWQMARDKAGMLNAGLLMGCVGGALMIGGLLVLGRLSEPTPFYRLARLKSTEEETGASP